MSVMFVVVPAVVASWPLLCAAAAGAAGVLGYKTMQSASASDAAVGEVETGVEVSLEGSEVLWSSAVSIGGPGTFSRMMGVGETSRSDAVVRAVRKLVKSLLN